MTTIIISHYQFTISDPHSPGEIIDLAAAQTLNSYRAGCLRDIASKWIAAASEDDQILSPSSLADLQRRISAYDALYTLKERTQRDAESPLQIELRRVAETTVSKELRQQGQEPTSVPSEVFDSLVEHEISTEFVQTEARRRLLAKNRAISIEALL